MQAVPAKLTRYGLSQVVNHLLGLGVGPVQAVICSTRGVMAMLSCVCAPGAELLQESCQGV